MDHRWKILIESFSSKQNTLLAEIQQADLDNWGQLYKTFSKSQNVLYFDFLRHMETIDPWYMLFQSFSHDQAELYHEAYKNFKL